jgi:simple sugar transport system substrate-binding protein/ribose transport system substrate-binding protein
MSFRTDRLVVTTIGRLAVTAAALCCSATAWAQGKGLEEPYRAGYIAALKGKTVAYLPIAQGIDLAQGWLAGLKSSLEPAGVRIVARDPNYSTTAGAQAFENLIAEKPDVIVVHNPDVQTYAKLIQRAEAVGIHVVQINMRSAVASSVYVGVDWIEMGERSAQAAIDACKGKSNKIAILQGQLTAAASAYSMRGIDNLLAKNPQVKVVSNQAADWDATKAKAVTQTVLKQHPDLCAIIGFWEGQDLGTAAAIKEAGLTGKVFLVTAGGAERKAACDMVKNGTFDLNIGYSVPDQAEDMASLIKWLLHSGVKPGAAKGSVYSLLFNITKANADTACWTLNK